MTNIIVYKSEAIFSAKARKRMHLYGCTFQELILRCFCSILFLDNKIVLVIIHSTSSV